MRFLNTIVKKSKSTKQGEKPLKMSIKAPNSKVIEKRKTNKVA